MAYTQSEATPTLGSPETIASTWLLSFVADIESPCSRGERFLENSFTDDSYWRDLLAFTPDYHTLYSRRRIQECLSGAIATARPTQFDILPDVRLRHTGLYKTFVQGIVRFRTDIAECTGVFTLVQTGKAIWKAWSFVTIMDRLRGVTEYYEPGLSLGRPFERKDIMQYGAIVLGAGQCGLAVAARLENIGVPTLLLEKSAQVGDSWRTRYKTLETNTPRAFNSLPFLPFPEYAGEHIPCASVADHLDRYYKVLGLHLLTSADATASYDVSAEKWTIHVAQPNQSSVTVIADHLIVATGVGTLRSEVPFTPSIPHSGSFQGRCVHSSQYSYSSTAKGKNAIVVGAGCSGHDIAQDLANKGARVTLVQRSPTAVVSREAMRQSFRGYFAPDILPIDVADRLYISLPFRALKDFQHEVMAANASIDKDLHEGLTKRGYLLPERNDNFLDRLVIRRGGYYIDRGCASLIASGKISVKAGVEISHLSPTGLVFADGTRVTTDLIVFATGFSPTTIKEVSQNLLGPEVAKLVNDFGGWTQDWEFAGIWRPSGHKGLWFAEGDLFSARFYSQLLALQIKAREMGLVTQSGDAYLSSAGTLPEF